jgi:hypothetical protein
MTDFVGFVQAVEASEADCDSLLSADFLCSTHSHGQFDA